jgi:hypothetical protein
MGHYYSRKPKPGISGILSILIGLGSIFSGTENGIGFIFVILGLIILMTNKKP